MKTSAVDFMNRSGYKLSGLLDLPDERPVKAYALFAHCFTCGKDLKPFANMNRALTDRDIGVLRFDFSGLGRSEGDFSESNIYSNETDVLDAAAFLEKNFAAPGILIGHSMGGVTVLRSARAVTSAKAVVTIASPADPNHLGNNLRRARDEAKKSGEAQVSIGGRTYTLKKQFFDDLDATRIKRDIFDLKKALLVLHSPDDTTVDIGNATQIFQAARHPKSFVSLYGADHLLLDERHARYAGTVIAAWLDNYL